ncbi:MAG: hypothetical protein JRG70_07880, partial [Deltaproteobacteria bacterium]|nr:hypothetical protein [Deltaproteobacteria bacterium]
MNPASSLPPLKKNDGKYGLIALLLLLAAGGLWFFFKSALTREQFAVELEIPEEDAGPGEGQDDTQVAKPGRPSQARPAEWDCRGSLPAAELRAVIKGPPSKQVQTCYERRLKDNNLLQGSMKVLITIGASG